MVIGAGDPDTVRMVGGCAAASLTLESIKLATSSSTYWIRIARSIVGPVEANQPIGVRFRR